MYQNQLFHPVVYLSNENSELRKKKEELQLDLLREKQITNVHLQLTEDLAAAKDALKNSCLNHTTNDTMENDISQVVDNASHDSGQQQPPKLQGKSQQQNNHQHHSKKREVRKSQPHQLQSQKQQQTLQQQQLETQQMQWYTLPITQFENPLDVTKQRDKEKLLHDLRQNRLAHKPNLVNLEVRSQADRFCDRQSHNPRTLLPVSQLMRKSTSSSACPAPAFQPSTVGDNISLSASAPPKHTKYILEKDLKRICFQEFFDPGSCDRTPCTFLHNIPDYLRNCEPVVNKIKGIQAVIKRNKKHGSRF